MLVPVVVAGRFHVAIHEPLDAIAGARMLPVLLGHAAVEVALDKLPGSLAGGAYA